RAAEKGGVNLQQLDWEMYPDVPSEQRLNYLAHDVLQLAKERSPFSLRLPNEAVPAGVGEQHVLNCLKALARFNPRHTNGSSLS
ncbi:MAG: hypothetical protein R3183_05860, partial [Oleiphilaceae bacterium]|nr:hypothetical protein [Oleiphilaceae bacterium]